MMTLRKECRQNALSRPHKRITMDRNIMDGVKKHWHDDALLHVRKA